MLKLVLLGSQEYLEAAHRAAARQSNPFRQEGIGESFDPLESSIAFDAQHLDDLGSGPHDLFLRRGFRQQRRKIESLERLDAPLFMHEAVRHQSQAMWTSVSATDRVSGVARNAYFDSGMSPAISIVF
jgi:hypothetical protein